MSEVVAIVEGETEQTFVRDQLAAHLGGRGVAIWPVLPGRHRRHRGVQEWAVARGDIVRTLKEGRYCTTMFDFYAMPVSWPGRSTAMAQPWSQRAAQVQAEMADDISLAMGSRFNPQRFIPYVQLHEFEALAFAGVDELASVTAPLLRSMSLTQETLRTWFGNILARAGSPEAINDSYETCPSRQITRHVPGYRKRVHGPIVTNRIGLNRLRAACPHFGEWLNQLERIEP